MADKQYKYSVEEKSLTQHWLTDHAWLPIVERLPSWLKPNTITASGGVAMLLSLLFIKTGLAGNRWGFLGAALCTAVYLIADNVDGPHARRTKQSSHFGEFLDHWLDSINGLILSLGTALSLGLKGGLLLLFVSVFALAYFATIWEQHRTGVFHSARLGTNEGILVGIGLYLLLFAFPTASWLRYSPGVFNFAAFMGVFASTVSALTVLGVIRRCHERLRDFLPLLLTTAVFGVSALTGLLNEQLAVTGILVANVLFTGALLIARLVGRVSRYRGIVASGASLVGLALTGLWPAGASNLWDSKVFLVVLAVVASIVIASDVLRAVLGLRFRVRV